MPPSSNTDPKAVAKEVGELIKMARKKELNFALLMAKDGMVLEAHPSKGSSVMRRQAKANGGGPKGTEGIMNVTGKVINLACSDDDFPKTLAKSTKRWLKDLGIAMKVIMVLPDGEMLDDGEAPELPPEPSQEQVDDVANDRRLALEAKLKELIKRTAALQAKAPSAVAKISEALKSAAAVLKGGDMESCATTLGKLETAIAMAEGIPDAPSPPLPERPKDPNADKPVPPTPDEAKAKAEQLRRARASLDALYDDLMRRGLPSSKDRAVKLDAAFDTAVKAAKFEDAAKVLKGLKAYLDAQIKAIPAETLWEKMATSSAKPAPDRLTTAKSIATKFPGASAAAEAAMDGFANVVGDQPITPQLLKQAKDELATAQQRKGDLFANLKRIQDLPDSPAKTEQLAVLQADLKAIEARIASAAAFDKALRGKKALGDALTFGPLSKDSAKSLSDGAAEELIKGFARNPELSTFTVEKVRSAKYPEELAKSLGTVLDKQDTGFRATDGRRYREGSPARDKYGAYLVEMAGNVGPGYTDGLDDYLASGRQFNVDPFGAMGAANATARAQLRSTKVAESLIDANGKIDLNSTDAKNAIGDLMFNPSVLHNPTPAMLEHALHTLEFLGDATTGPQAQKVLDDMPDTPSGAAVGLVARSLGKPATTTVVTKAESQAAVLASMLKPLDQGPVGSCFSTAPARRLRETDPVAAMESFAQIAGEGKYKPPFGPEVPAVTNLPADEDPIMRSLEYSLATSTARRANSSRKETFALASAKGAQQMAKDLAKIQIKADLAKGIKGVGKAAKHKLESFSLPKKLVKHMADAFTFTYDPTSTITDANDGSSTTGRYILVLKSDGSEVRSAADFSAAAAKMGIAFMGMDDPSDAADAVRAYTATPQFAAMFEFTNYKPWEQSSGGQTTAATQTLFGENMQQRELVAKGSGTSDVHDRAESILESIVENFGDSGKEMITIRTVGMHGFNATPNDPSLDPLKGNTPQEIAQKIKVELLDKGAALKSSVMTVEQTRAVYDKGFAAVRRDFSGDATVMAQLEKAISDNAPSVGMTMKDIKTAIDAASVQFSKAGSFATNEDEARNYVSSVCGSASQDLARAELGAPEFVIADSNWGSSKDHTFFVISPDLTTGEPTLYQKTVPPGTLTPADDDWARATWASIE